MTQKMNKIEQLIAELCPEGVEFVELGQVTMESTERNVKRKITDVKSVTNSNGLIATTDFFSNTRTSKDTSNYKIVRPNMVVYNPSRINVGSIAIHNENTHIIVSPMYVVFKIDSQKITPNFFDIFLKSNYFKYQMLAKVEIGARFRLPYNSFSKLKIPIPPIEIQEEIVRILDKFTALEAELEAELEARKKQYEYYREQLLTFGDDKVEWKELGEAGELIRGSGLPKTDFTELGVPAIHYGQIYTYYGVYTTKTISFVSKETAKKLKKVNNGDVVITNTSENLEDVGKAVVYLGKQEAVTGGHATIFKPKEILGKYFAYYTQTAVFFKEKRRYAKGIKVIDVSAKDMAKIKIPIPPLSKQKQIIAVLDKFDALVNSLSEGLPAEIDARRKQYEYYRERLLTFKEKK